MKRAKKKRKMSKTVAKAKARKRQSTIIRNTLAKEFVNPLAKVTTKILRTAFTDLSLLNKKTPAITNIVGVLKKEIQTRG